MKKYAVVTAYNGEDFDIIKRCHDSIKGQTLKTDHIIVCDGKYRDFLTLLDARIIALDKNHGDYGNTPRSIGANLVACERYDGFCFCDSDNWLDSHHIETCIEQARRIFGEDRCDCIVTSRTFRREDGKILSVREDDVQVHVDTGCIFYFPGSYYTLAIFSLIPQELSIAGDRVFWTALKQKGLNIGFVDSKTVNYTTLWRKHYTDSGEIPPANAREDINKNKIILWKHSLTPRETEVFERGVGIKIG